MAKRHRWTERRARGDACGKCGLEREYSHYGGNKSTLRYYRDGRMIACSQGAHVGPQVARGCPPCEPPPGWVPPEKPRWACAGGCGTEVVRYGEWCRDCGLEDGGDSEW